MYIAKASDFSLDLEPRKAPVPARERSTAQRVSESPRAPQRAPESAKGGRQHPETAERPREPQQFPAKPRAAERPRELKEIVPGELNPRDAQTVPRVFCNI